MTLLRRIFTFTKDQKGLEVLGGTKHFSAMDLISGYWQIELPPEDQINVQS